MSDLRLALVPICQTPGIYGLHCPAFLGSHHGSPYDWQAPDRRVCDLAARACDDCPFRARGNTTFSDRHPAHNDGSPSTATLWYTDSRSTFLIVVEQNDTSSQCLIPYTTATMGYLLERSSWQPSLTESSDLFHFVGKQWWVWIIVAKVAFGSLNR